MSSETVGRMQQKATVVMRRVMEASQQLENKTLAVAPLPLSADIALRLSRQKMRLHSACLRQDELAFEIQAALLIGEYLNAVAYLRDQAGER